jgi:ribosomal protein S18 acetylase RimI-like enzyme
MTTASHVLDNPVWHALSTVHSSFGEGDDLAKRYAREIGPLAAVKEPSMDSYRSLARMLGPDDVAGLVYGSPLAPPSSFNVLRAMEIGQMVCESPALTEPEHKIERLDHGWITEMLALTELTKPGPFGPRTPELGTYLGITESGRLAAMAGVRVRMPGFTEISAVCTHPDFRGRRYARSLVSALIIEISRQGDVPFLHVRLDNADAVHVYEKLGFRIRRSMHLAILTRGQH